LRTHYGLASNGANAGGFSAGEHAVLAAQAPKLGMTQCITISRATALDTFDETWATDYPVRLRDGFNALSTLVDD